MKKFMARSAKKNGTCGWEVFEYENEMYAALEVQGITEDNPDVVGINYYEVELTDSGETHVVRVWDFGKPWKDDYWTNFNKVKKGA